MTNADHLSRPESCPDAPLICAISVGVGLIGRAWDGWDVGRGAQQTEYGEKRDTEGTEGVRLPEVHGRRRSGEAGSKSPTVRGWLGAQARETGWVARGRWGARGRLREGTYR